MQQGLNTIEQTTTPDKTTEMMEKIKAGIEYLWHIYQTSGFIDEENKKIKPEKKSQIILEIATRIYYQGYNIYSEDESRRLMDLFHSLPLSNYDITFRELEDEIIHLYIQGTAEANASRIDVRSTITISAVPIDFMDLADQFKLEAANLAKSEVESLITHLEQRYEDLTLGIEGKPIEKERDNIIRQLAAIMVNSGFNETKHEDIFQDLARPFLSKVKITYRQLKEAMHSHITEIERIRTTTVMQPVLSLLKQSEPGLKKISIELPEFLSRIKDFNKPFTIENIQNEIIYPILDLLQIPGIYTHLKMITDAFYYSNFSSKAIYLESLIDSIVQLSKSLTKDMLEPAVRTLIEDTKVISAAINKPDSKMKDEKIIELASLEDVEHTFILGLLGSSGTKSEIINDLAQFKDISKQIQRFFIGKFREENLDSERIIQTLSSLDSEIINQRLNNPNGVKAIINYVNKKYPDALTDEDIQTYTKRLLSATQQAAG